MQSAAHEAPPPHDATQAWSQPVPPFDEEVEDALVPVVVVAGAVTSVQASFEICAHTSASVCFARSAAASSHVVNVPTGQTNVLQPQTRSTTEPRMRNPQFGIEAVSTTTLGQSVVAWQSWMPVLDSTPQPPPTALASVAIEASVVVVEVPAS